MISSIVRVPSLSDLPWIALFVGTFLAGGLLTQLVDEHRSAPPAAPSGLEASQGDHSEYVKLRWEQAEEATHYRIYRDGEFIDSTDTPRYRDDGATSGGQPEAPDVEATTDRTDGVEIRWDTPEVVDGPVHTYEVQTVKGDERGHRASTAGYRGGEPIVEYQISMDAAAWTSVGDTTSHLDTDADESSIAPGEVSATSGEYEDHVLATVQGSKARPGDPSTYRVRAMAESSTGKPSDNVEGRIAAGELTHQWQRSTTPDGDQFEDIGGADRPWLRDTDAPADGSSRQYRVVVDADGADPRPSPPATGSRQGDKNEPPQFAEGDPDQSPDELCAEITDEDCECRHDDGLYLCHPEQVGETRGTYIPMYLVDPGEKAPRARRVGYAKYEFGRGCGGGHTTEIDDFEFVERRGDIAHVTVTMHHDYTSMAGVSGNGATLQCETTTGIVVDLSPEHPPAERGRIAMQAMFEQSRACDGARMDEFDYELEMEREFDRDVQFTEDGRVWVDDFGPSNTRARLVFPFRQNHIRLEQP